MNILVVNENFTGGGLETHIHSYYMELRERHHFVFAFGNFKSKLEFDEADVHLGFHFGWRCSVGEFVEDVERLIQLIQKEKIDVVHAHPFHSIFPAVVAGQLTGVPVACTHHGTYSFAFPGGVNEALLLYYAYTELVSCVFSVSDMDREALKDRAHVPNVVFMPNPIDSSVYRRHAVVNNRRWAVVSRLDGDLGKSSALEKLFALMPQLPIDSIDVYGDGAQRSQLEKCVEELGVADRIRFMGFQSDLYDRLDGNYNGIIGTDRVAMEGLTMGYPVLELGYGQICGMLYGDLLQKAKRCNFVANILPAVDGGMVASQLEQVYVTLEQFDFRQEMVDTFDIQIIAQAYVEQLAALAPAPHANMVAWFDAVKALPNLRANFYGSPDVFQTIQTHIKPYAIDRNMTDLFLLENSCVNLKNEIGRLGVSLSERSHLLGQAQAQISGLEEARGRLQAQLFSVEEMNGQLQVQFAALGETQAQLQARLSSAEEAQGQLQAWLSSVEEAQGQLQAHFQEQLQMLTQSLAQLQEQTEYHRKILAPLIWLRRLLSKIKWKIKGWLH